MLSGIFHFVFYLFIGGIGGWLFQLLAGLIEGLFIFGIFGVLTGFKGEGFEERVELFPKRFVLVLMTKNVIVGTLNAIIIFMATGYFLQETGANLWLYIVLSIVWSLYIHGYTPSYHVMYFMTSTVTLILYWLGFGVLATIFIPLLVFIVSLAYYLGRVDVVIENQGILNQEVV